MVICRLFPVMAENPFLHLEGHNVRTDRRRERRSLSTEDFGRLLVATRPSKQAFRYLTGEDRYILYLTASRTGLRVQELTSLTRGHFDLTAEVPTVAINAVDDKARRGETIPLHPEVVRELSRWFELRSRCATSVPITGNWRDEPLWPGSWWRVAAKMLRKDLQAVRSAWIKEASDDAERGRREQSDRLTFTDDNGRVFDFHSLRGQFVSDLGRAGVSLQDAQKLARHSDPRLTANFYTHLSVSDLSESVSKLPHVPTEHRETVAATGTDGNCETNHRTKTGAEQCRSMPKPEFFTGLKLVELAKEKTRKSQSDEDLRVDSIEEAPPGFEPGMADLQSAALGHLATAPDCLLQKH